MCGISGLINLNGEEVTIQDIKKMNNIVKHRGPDGEDYFQHKNFAFGHRRLSIIDLSDGGKQPMEYLGKHVIIFNGEIYNYIEIRDELRKFGYQFRSKSDTEVILAAYDKWGENCVNHFNGMWAFAIYDKQKEIIFCSRDRFGIKPFYFVKVEKYFAFGSEIKQFLPLIKNPKINYKTLINYLAFNLTDHSHETFFDSIFSLLGGHNLIFDLISGHFSIFKYYKLTLNEDISRLSVADSVKLFQEEFKRSVNLRLRSDVKVGTCLSGGLDSSYLAFVASNCYQLESNQKFGAIIGISKDPKNDESNFAKTVVQKLNLDWFATSPGKLEFENKLDEVITSQDEPFGSPSIIFQNFVMEKAHESGIKVLLDGQGADEILLGYPRYFPSFLRQSNFFERLKRIQILKRNSNLNYFYLIRNELYFGNFWVRKFNSKLRLLKIRSEFSDLVDWGTIHELSESFGNIKELQKIEILKTQIPQLLKWEDRNSMEYSLETRLPYLDWKIVEICLSMNDNYKIRNGWTKYPLRKAMEMDLPESIVWRKKKIGFNAPVDIWFNDFETYKNAIMDSSILRGISKGRIGIPSNKNFFWRLFNIAKWEKLLGLNF